MERETKYLSEMTKGQKGIVTDVETENCPERGRRLDHTMRHGGLACGTGCASRWGALQRLRELGITLGTEVTLADSAQNDGSLEIFVRGDRVTLGKGFASKIIVAMPMHSQDLSRGSMNGTIKKG